MLQEIYMIWLNNLWKIKTNIFKLLRQKIKEKLFNIEI